MIFKSFYFLFQVEIRTLSLLTGFLGACFSCKKNTGFLKSKSANPNHSLEPKPTTGGAFLFWLGASEVEGGPSIKNYGFSNSCGSKRKPNRGPQVAVGSIFPFTNRVF